MIFKQLPTMISDLNKLGVALKSLDALNFGTVGVNLGNIESYRAALKGLSIEQSVFALASKGATDEQIRQILVTDQAMSADVEAALAKAGLTTATKALNAEELIELATKKGISSERAKEIASALGLIATEEGQIISKKQLTVATLKQAGATDAEIASILGLNAAETANIGITNVLTASFTKLWAVITAHPIGAILTAIGAVAVGTIAYINKVNNDAEKALVEAHENAKQALEDTKISLSDDKSELQSINSELETTKERIKEISSIGAPTLTEQNELNKLSTANAQLEAQQTLLENNIKLKQKSAALDAKELLGTQVEMKYSSILDNSSITSSTKSYSYADHVEYQADYLKNAYNIYMRALKEGNVRRQELAQELITASGGNAAELTSELLDIVESFKYDDGTIIDGYEDLYNEYMGMIYNLQSLTNPNTFLDIAKSITVGTGIDYEKAISEAYALAYEGNFDIDNLNQDFIKALENAGIDKETVGYIFKLKQQEYQVLIDKINSKYDSSKISYTYWDSEGKTRHDYEKEESAKTDIEKVNQDLNEYARENPIEFQLVTSYDENFALLDKYIEEEKTKSENSADYVGDYVENAIQRIYDEAKAKSEAFNSNTITSFADALSASTDYSDYLSKFQNLAEQGGLSADVLSSTEEYANILEALGYSAEDAAYSLKQFFGELDYGNMMDGLEDSLTPIIEAQLQLAKNGKLDFDTVQELLDIEPDFIKQLQAVEGGYITTDAALQNLIDTKLYNFELDNNDAVKAANKVIESLGGEAIAYGLTTDEIIKQIKAQIALIQAKQIEVNKLVESATSMSSTERIFGSKNILTSGLTNSQEKNDIQLHTGNNGAYSEDIKQLNAILDSIENAQTNTEKAKEIYEQLKQQVTDSFNKSSSSSSSSTTSSKDFDWIETRLENLNNTLDKTKAKISDTYATWTERNNALQDTIAKTNEAINLQGQAYERYMQEANSVGLPESWKTLVQNGAIDISTITDDETLKDKISEYETWYEKAQECLKTQEDLRNELNELNSQPFTNIKSEYDAVIERMQSAYDLLESQITLLSSSGDYDTLRTKQSDIVNKLQSERNALQNTLNSSGIKQYSEEWYNLVSQIDDLDSQILDAENALKEIDTMEFDNIKEAFDFDTSVLEHGLQMIQSKVDLLELKGQFANESYYNGMIQYTQKELDTLLKERTQLQNILNNTLHKQGTTEWNNMYSTLMDIDEEIDSMTSNLVEFNNAIRDLNWETFKYLEESINRITDETNYLIDLMSKKDLFDENGQRTKYGTTTIALHATAYDVYKQQAQDYYEEVQDLQRQLVNGAGKEVLEQYNEMVQAHRDAILAAEQERQSIFDLIEEGYNAQLDAIQELIDKKKKQMNQEKALFDYERSIAEKSKNIASLEKQKLAYEGDTSEEAISKIQQIKVSLEEAKADLKETEYEQYLSDTEIMLDNLSSDYESWLNARLDHSDELLTQIVGEVSTQGSLVNDTLNEVASEYGTFISDSLNTVFNSDSPFTTSLTTGLNGISNNLTTGLNGVSTSIDKVGTAVSGTTAAINDLVAKVANITGADASKTNAGTNTSNGSSASGSSNTPNVPSTPTTPTNTPVSKPVTPSAPSSSNSNTSSNSNKNTSSSQTTSSATKTGKALLDEILIAKKDYYNKSKLNRATSVVDELKYFDKDSSFSARSMYWSKIFGGTYTGSASQNTKLLNYLKANGYKKGSPHIPNKQLAWTQEDGEEIIYRASDGAMLTPLGQGDMVFTNESSKVLWDLSKNPSAFLEKFGLANVTPQINVATPTMPEITPREQNVSMDVGDINIEMNLPNATDYISIRKALVQDGTFKEAFWNELTGMPIKKMGATNWSALNSGSGVPISMRNR